MIPASAARRRMGGKPVAPAELRAGIGAARATERRVAPASAPGPASSGGAGGAPESRARGAGPGRTRRDARCEAHLPVSCTGLSPLTDALRRPFTDSLDCLASAIPIFARS